MANITEPGVNELWAERGFPTKLLAEARDLGLSDTKLKNLMLQNATRERIEEEVEWSRRLRDSALHFRQLTPFDDEAFRDLWANSPEAIGDWDVFVERGENAFAQFEMQERPVLNGLFDGETMVACISFSIRRTVVGGKDIVIHYGQAMRVHNAHRGQRYAHWVRSLPWAVGLGRPTHLQYDYIRSGNMAMDKWNKRFMSRVESVQQREDNVPGSPVTVMQYAGKSIAAVRGVRPATADDMARCAELINLTHTGRDLFRPYTTESLMERLDAGLMGIATRLRSHWRRPYALEDFYVMEDGDEIVACAGLWDRGRDMRERWYHRETGNERNVAVTALLDFGYAQGREDALAALIEHLIGMSHQLQRDFLVAPIEGLPQVEALLAAHEPISETRYMQWRADTPAITGPIYLDLVYW
ncbi:MAG TPA: hypothetical protein VJ998_07870 [Pseudomonadales bacterium]|nr:hypothetical protein [Pseudomonadales bacterium]